MKGAAEIAKGRIEEAAGTLVNNDKLRVRGQSHQALGHVRQTAQRGIQRVQESTRKIVDKAKHTAKRTVDKYKGGE